MREKITQANLHILEQQISGEGDNCLLIEIKTKQTIFHDSGSLGHHTFFSCLSTIFLPKGSFSSNIDISVHPSNGAFSFLNMRFYVLPNRMYG